MYNALRPAAGWHGITVPASANVFPAAGRSRYVYRLGAITGRGVDQRLAASVAAAILAVQRGSRILRVHDVREAVEAIRVIGQMTNK